MRSGRPASSARERGCPVGGLVHHVAVLGKVRRDGLPGHLVILDEEQVGAAHGRSSGAGWRRMRMPSPPIGLASAMIVPPMASTNPRAMASPIPIPRRAGACSGSTR